MFNDLTQIRHFKQDKALWRAAIACSPQKVSLSEWIRLSLNAAATDILRKVSRKK